MGELIISYVTYEHRHRRLHGSATSVFRTTDLGNFPPPPRVGVPIIPDTYDGKPLAFISITGSPSDSGTYFRSSPPPDTIDVGTSDINILVVYAPFGGGPGPMFNGVFIDAFDEITGQFLDNDFVTVTPGSPAINTEANAEGDVITTSSIEHITAADTLNAPEGVVYFDKWVNIFGDGFNITDHDCNLSASGNHFGIAIAFYGSAPRIVFGKLREDLKECLEQGFSIIMTDTGPMIVPGHHGPDGGGGPFGFSISPKVLSSLNSKQQEEIKSLANNYHSVAKSAFKEGNKAIDIVSQIAQIVGAVNK